MSLANRFRTVSRRNPESESWPVRRGRGEEGDDVTPSRPVWRVPTDDDSTVPSAVNRTLAELRDAAVEAAWPSRNLALRAARLATDGAVYPLLLRIADKQYLRAARLGCGCRSPAISTMTTRWSPHCAWRPNAPASGGTRASPTTASDGWLPPSACAFSTGQREMRSVRDGFGATGHAGAGSECRMWVRDA